MQAVLALISEGLGYPFVQHIPEAAVGPNADPAAPAAPCCLSSGEVSVLSSSSAPSMAGRATSVTNYRERAS